MVALRVFVPIVASIFSLACMRAHSAVQLRVEEPTVLRLGQAASLVLPTADAFTVGSAGAALRLANRFSQDGRTTYVYRAVEPGDQTLVATPIAPGTDGCVSCVTRHYFIKVTP